jgi:hypothetical protein
LGGSYRCRGAAPPPLRCSGELVHLALSWWVDKIGRASLGGVDPSMEIPFPVAGGAGRTAAGGTVMVAVVLFLCYDDAVE